MPYPQTLSDGSSHCFTANKVIFCKNAATLNFCHLFAAFIVFASQPPFIETKRHAVRADDRGVKSVMGWYETGQEKAQTRSSCRRQPWSAVSAVRRCDTAVAAESPCPQRGHAHSVSELLNPNLSQGLQFVSCRVSCEAVGAHCSHTAFGLAARKPQPAAEPGSGEHLPAALWLSDRKWLRHTIESERETGRESK